MKPTLQEFVAAFEAAAVGADNLSGNPLLWSSVRGILAVVKMEREACAKIAEARASEGETGTWQANEGLVIASYIRKRSNEH